MMFDENLMFLHGVLVLESASWRIFEGMTSAFKALMKEDSQTQLPTGARQGWEMSDTN